MRRITVDERRARLGIRHALAGQGAADVVDAARAVVGLHGTDPASTFLAALARTPGATTDDVERALYDDRTLVRVLAMRRTLFAVPREDVGIVLVGAGADIGRQQRTLLEKMLVESEVTDDPGPWVDRAEAAALAAMDGAGEIMSTELAKADPLLGTRVEIAPGTKYATTASIASRMLTLMSADGKVVRTRPRGGWTSTQFRWATLDDWVGQVERPDTATASSEMARLWLRSYGPASLDDLQWWTGWTKTRTRAALATLDTVEVDLDGSPGLLLADDAEPVPVPTRGSRCSRPSTRPRWAGSTATSASARTASCSTTSTATPGPRSGPTDGWSAAGPSATTARWWSVCSTTSAPSRRPASRSELLHSPPCSATCGSRHAPADGPRSSASCVPEPDYSSA